MTPLTIDQKRMVIDTAKEAYLNFQEEKAKFGDVDAVMNRSLHESCYIISSIIYHVVKEQYGITDDNNKLIHGTIRFGEGVHEYRGSHFINQICGEFIAASIEQFNNKVEGVTFSPYGNNEKYYSELEEAKPLPAQLLAKEINFCTALIDIRENRFSRKPKQQPPNHRINISKIFKFFG